MTVKLPRIRAILPWLMEIWHFWLAVVVIVSALAVGSALILFNHSPESAIRLTGLVLQLCGLVTVILGIRKTRAFFGHPSLLSKGKKWLKKFPLFRQDMILKVDSVTMRSSIGEVRPYGTSAPSAPTVEARLEALEENIESIHERISQTQKGMDKGFQKAADALRREEQTRKAGDAEIRVKLEEAGTGGINISLMGALWLFVGVFLSTAAPEIAPDIAELIKLLFLR